MASSDELLAAIAALGQAFPQFLQREISRLTDEFVGSVKSFTNPFAQVGDLSLQSLVAEVATLAEGSGLGDVSAVAGIVDQLAISQLGLLSPSALTPSTGNRIQDVLNLSGSIAGQMMLTLAMVPETPYAIAQRICASVVELAETKLATLECLSKHILQLSNAMTIVVQMRNAVADGLFVDLATADAALVTALREFSASERGVQGAWSLDQNALSRGKAALEAAATALLPKLPALHTSALGLESVLSMTAALPAPISTPLNARVAVSIVSHLVELVRKEVDAVSAQTDAIAFQLQQLRSVVTNYRALPAAQGALAIRLQIVGAILVKLQDLEASVRMARLRDPVTAAAPQLIDWSVTLQSLIVLADKARVGALVEGADDLILAGDLQAAYGGLLKALDAISGPHVKGGTEDMRDLESACLGLCTHAERLLQRAGQTATRDSELRTFQVLVANTALKTTGRVKESEASTTALLMACQPMQLISIPSRVKVDALLSSLDQLGLDRGRDLLASGQFGALLSANLDDLSYLGAAISALTTVLAGIDDAGLRRQVAAIREDLLGRKTNSLLGAADTIDFAGLRRTSAIKDEIAALQKNAETVSGILDYLKALAGSLSLDLSGVDSASAAGVAGSVDGLAIQAGGRLATALGLLSRPSAGMPEC